MPVLQRSPVHIRVVVEGDGSILLKAVEDSAQLAQHRRVVGVIGGGGVGAAQEAPLEGFIVEDLLVGHLMMREGGAEEGAEGAFIDVFVADEGIVGGELLEEIFVSVQKR